MALRELQIYRYVRQKIRSSGPVLVFIATFALMAVSTAGLTVALLLYNVQGLNTSVGVIEILTLLSSAVSFIFVGFYLLAVRRDEPVSKTRPPTLPLHGACFIIMRISALLWAADMFAALATTFQIQACQEDARVCVLQRIDMIVSILAIIAAIFIIIGLETCEKPFKIPFVHMLRPKIVLRVSFFDEYWDQSVSCRPSFEHSTLLECQRSARSIHSGATLLGKTPTSDASSPFSKNLSCTATLLEDPQGLNSYALGKYRVCQSFRPVRSEKTPIKSSVHNHGLIQPGRYTTRASMSSPFEEPSGSLNRASSSETSESLSKVSPSSSITVASRRSPLSTVRSVEDPEFPVDTELHVCPLIFSHAVGRSGASLLPAERVSTIRRRASKGAHEPNLRKFIIQAKSRNESSVPERHALYCSTFNPANGQQRVTEPSRQQSTLDGHSKLIEERIFAAVLRRLQEEQRRREQALQEQIDIAEIGYKRYLESRGNRDQAGVEIVPALEPLSENVPVLPELDLDLDIVEMGD